MEKRFYVCILTNKYNKVLYTGVTNDLIKRIHQHKSKMIDGFTKKYNVDRLVYFEIHNEVETAIKREKYIKGITRQKKLDLINSINRAWRDLYQDITSSG